MMQFIILSIALWRLTMLIVHDSLPFELGDKFRDKIGVNYDDFGEQVATNQLAQLFTCVWCMGIWISLPFALYFYRENFFIYWLALSGSMLIIDKYVRG